jgi:hypothetical protein
MSSSPLTLKNPRGWFAAGVEVEKAMTALSDGAFKLFVYLCLNARRDTGVLEISQTELARNLKKGQQTLRRYFDEMRTAGICQSRFSHSPLGRGMIEISEAYWPYQAKAEETATDAASAYVVEIKKMLLARACVQTSLSTADEILAREWFERGITLERIEQAILMGCSRKYVSWRNNQTRTPIGSLRYFEPILGELQDQKMDPEYWGYVRYRMDRMEKLWKESFGKSLSSVDGPEAAAKGKAPKTAQEPRNDP